MGKPKADKFTLFVRRIQREDGANMPVEFTACVMDLQSKQNPERAAKDIFLDWRDEIGELANK